MNNKNRLLKLGILVLTVFVFLVISVIGLKHIKIDEFKPASVIFIIDSSASNQKELPKQIKYLKQLCSILDPEDKIKIIKVSQKAYIIYEGSPFNYSEINQSLKKYTKYNPKEFGTAYKSAIDKAFLYSKSMKKDGYIPTIIILGDLEDEGNINSKINWTKFAKKVEELQQTAPEFSLIFLFAHPEKLDFAKEKLIPVLGENKLIIASEETVNKATSKILRAIER